MNKLTVICFGLIVGGCAPTDQLAETNAKIQELEKKIARIEGDLYKVEMKSAPKQVAEPKFVPAKEVEQNVIDTKINAFLKEYLGAQFGDSIEKYPDMTVWWGKEYKSDEVRAVKVLKKFKYFDKAEVGFEDGKLVSVKFYADIDKKYSVDSTNEQVNQALADMAVTFGLASTAFDGRILSGGLRRPGLQRTQEEPRSSYYLGKHNGECAPKGFRRCGAVIADNKLRRKYEEDKKARERAAGEKLPDVK